MHLSSFVTTTHVKSRHIIKKLTMSEWQTSYFLEDRSKPINPRNASLNDTLQTQYIDLDDNDDSMGAHAVRAISSCVGSICTPKQVLGLLRVLKAVTLSFLMLSIVANLMYILFVEILSSDEVKAIAGGSRDTILRLYGLGLSLLSVAIELDYTKVVKKFSGLKGFLPRAVLYFFISQITALHPLAFQRQDNLNNNNSNQAYNYNDNNNNNGNDDGAGNNNDENGVDDAYAASQQYVSTTNGDNSVPTSAIGFQRVTSIVLGFCALGYLICGLLCFDRFTARAFLSTKDPRVTTALPPAPQVPVNSSIGRPNGELNQPMDDSIMNDSSTA